MKKIVSFFRNLFKSKGISRNEILAYAAYQLSAMIEFNPDSVFDDRIPETTTAYNGMESAMRDDPAAKGLQLGRTRLKRAFRQTLPTQLAKLYGVALGQFGANSAELDQCFPSGRSIFDRCRDEQLGAELKGVADGFNRHATALPAPAVAAAAALVTTWDGLLGTQTVAKIARKEGVGTINEAHAALQRALYRNMLWIAYHFPEDEAKCDFYCPQYLLENRAAPVTPGATTLQAGPFDPVTKQTVLSMTATDAESYRLLRRLMGEADFTVIAEGIEAVDGTGTYTDTMVAPGTYEYVAEAVNGTRVGERSGIVSVVQS